MLNSLGMEECGAGTINFLTPTNQANIQNGYGYINATAYDRESGDGCESRYVPPKQRHAIWNEGQRYDEDKNLANTPKKKKSTGAKWGEFIEQQWKERNDERHIKTY